MKVFKHSLSQFSLVVFAVLAQSVAAMTTVVAAHVVAVPADHRRSIDRDWRYCPLLTGRLLVHSPDTCAGLGFRGRFWLFFAYKKLLPRPN